MAEFSLVEFGERLRKQRIKAGYNRQEDLAAAIGLSVQSVNFYENGKRKPEPEILSKLASALNCSSDYLLQNESTTTHDVAYIMSETGLSEAAIDKLRQMKKVSVTPEFSTAGIELAALSKLLSCKSLHKFLEPLFYYFIDDYKSIQLYKDKKIHEFPLNSVFRLMFSCNKEQVGAALDAEGFIDIIRNGSFTDMSKALSEMQTELLGVRK